jgi:hypothetical protein
MRYVMRYVETLGSVRPPAEERAGKIAGPDDELQRKGI